jgi:hypothetical protein
MRYDVRLIIIGSFILDFVTQKQCDEQDTKRRKKKSTGA